MLSRKRSLVIAFALLALEFAVGIQSYVVPVVTPQVTTEFGAKDLYSVAYGLPLMATFASMPLGPYLLARFSVNRLIGVLTAISVAGSTLTALSSSMAMFVGGRVVVGLAAGAMMTVTLGGVLTSLREEHRRAVLAGFAAVWLVSSPLAPVYLAATNALGSWRWALVLYLPLLVAARVVIAVAMPRGGARERERAPQGSQRQSLGLTNGLILALGAGGLALAPVLVPGLIVFAYAAGAFLLVLGAQRTLPAGTLRGRGRRPGAVLLLATMTFAYFGAQAAVPILATDILRLDATMTAIALACGGFGWAVTGAIVGKVNVSRSKRRGRAGEPDTKVGEPAVPFPRTVVWVGLLLLGVGIAALAGSVAVFANARFPASGEQGLAFALLVIGWSLAGVGIGLAYLETYNAILAEPTPPDGISPGEAGAAAGISESIAVAVSATVVSGLASLTLSTGNMWLLLGALVFLALVCAAALPLPTRVAGGGPTRASSRGRSADAGAMR